MAEVVAAPPAETMASATGQGSRGQQQDAPKMQMDHGILSKMLQETGERDRLKEYIQQTLTESGDGVVWKRADHGLCGARYP